MRGAMGMNEQSAPLYYLTHTGVSGDLDFYVAQLSKAMKVLELGCGNGRLTSVLLSHGHRVVAIDRSAYAIESLQSFCSRSGSNGELTTIKAEFENLQLDGPFDCAILSFNSFLCLDAEGKVDLLKTVHRALRPGGLFLLDFYDGADFIMVDETDDEPWLYEPEYLCSVEHQGETFDVYQSGRFMPSERQIIMHYDHFLPDCEDPDESLAYEITHHILSLSEFQALLTEFGFRTDQITQTESDGSTHLFCNAVRMLD